jgi:D-serine dehydratase
MAPLLSGCFTVRDEQLLRQLVQVLDATGERIEPSAAAGFGGPAMLTGSDSGRPWLAAQGLQQHLARATHLVWTTGGLFVPPDEYERFVQRGRALS